jgi:transketolase
MNNDIIRDLESKARKARIELVRMFGEGKAHHYGGSLSCIDILAALYFYKMNYSIANWQDSQRDRFIMGKGHSVPAQYIMLAMLGIIQFDELKTIKQFGSRLQGHPDINKTPGIEAPTGSLGQGLSFANGIALAARFDNRKFRLYVMLGDGELQEGQIWESLMTTNHYKLSNITIIVDRNKYQSQGSIDDLMSIEPLDEKFRSFGWHTSRVDGHDMRAICTALDEVDSIDKPCAIIADTIKGKGVSFLENTYKYHNYSLNHEEFERAMRELNGNQ